MYQSEANAPISFIHLDQASLGSNFVGSFFQGTFEVWPEVQNTGPNIIPPLIYEDGAMSLSTPDNTFQGLVQSMTSYARNTASGSTFSFGQVNGTYAMWSTNGTAWKQDTCINVHWPCIAFPATMAVGTVLFLAATVFSTDSASESRKQDYKVSIQPVIMHDI